MPRLFDPFPLLVIKDIIHKIKRNQNSEEGVLEYDLDWVQLTGHFRKRSHQLGLMRQFLKQGLVKAISVNFSKPPYLEGGALDKQMRGETILLTVQEAELPLQEYKSTSSSYPKLIYKIEYKLNTLQNYVQNYLSDWKEGHFYISEGNLCHAPRQLHLVTKYINDLLERYPPKNLYVRDLSDPEVDFLAVMIFLEQEGFLRIHSLEGFKSDEKEESSLVHLGSPYKRGLAMRLDLHSSYLKIFNKNDLSMRDYHFIINKESILDQKIIFDSHRILYHKKLHHEMNYDCIPFHFMHLATDYEGTIKLDKLKEASGVDDISKIRKALGNFKSALRTKFDLSEDHTFFTKEGDKWILDEDQFYFLPKKAMIRLSTG